MLISAQTSRDGLALLIHTSISPLKPLPTVRIPGVLVSVELSLHTDPSVLAARVASFYSLHRIRDKHTCRPVLDPLLFRNLILLGDFNAVTEAPHRTGLKPTIWPWLVAKERFSALSDLLLPHSPHTPYTRMRRYGGSKSYIDWVYGSPQFLCPFSAIGRFRPTLFQCAWCAEPRPRSGEDYLLDGATRPRPSPVCAVESPGPQRLPARDEHPVAASRYPHFPRICTHGPSVTGATDA